MWRYLMIIISFSECFTDIDASNSTGVIVSSDCVCQGQTLNFECSIFGGSATIWKGNAFDCMMVDNEILLLHTQTLTHRTCNRGAIAGHLVGVNVENNVFTSQLTVNVSSELNGTSIACIRDDGEMLDEVDSLLLEITSVPFSPPNDVHLIKANTTHLRFHWTEVSTKCPTLRYQITSSNCGECPGITFNAMATCIGNYTQLLSGDHQQQCTFRVQTVVCKDIVGVPSIAVSIPSYIVIDSGESKATNETESRLSECVQETNEQVPNSTVTVTFGVIVAVLCVGIILIGVVFVTTAVILARSKIALQKELLILKSSMNDKSIIYEEIAQDTSLRSPSPTITTGENTAYISSKNCA